MHPINVSAVTAAPQKVFKFTEFLRQVMFASAPREPQGSHPAILGQPDCGKADFAKTTLAVVSGPSNEFTLRGIDEPASANAALKRNDPVDTNDSRPSRLRRA